jgi:hypothetical protein
MSVMADSRPVVWISHRVGEHCAGCGQEVGRGTLIVITAELGVRCLACAGLADLQYLPAGDPALSRRALAGSPRSAVVVEFSRSRKRHERRGVLVESFALAAAQQACEADAPRRAAARERGRERAEREQQAYVVRFADRIVELFPGCPRGEADVIARRACETGSGRVGRSGAARSLAARPVELAVQAYVRHRHTSYDDLLMGGVEPADARTRVAPEIAGWLARWRESAPAPPS